MSIKSRTLYLCLLLANVLVGAGATDAGLWDNRFFSRGVNGAVNAIVVNGQTLYVGGKFSAAGGVAVTNIAKWDGTNWSALGSGVNGVVNALALSGNDLYVGGNFTNAGGLSANRVAKWNGTSWSALGKGIGSNSVSALAVSASGVLYAAGDFIFAGEVEAINVAKWDGANWSALGGGVSDIYQAYASALAIIGNDVYVGGYFTKAGSVAANNLAKWNGTDWSEVGGGVDDLNYPAQVSALAVSGNQLYVGGAFSTAGSVNAYNIARWNGTSWSALGDGLERYYGDLPVSALAIVGSQLVAGGRFVSAGLESADNVAAWDGTSWIELGGGVNGNVKALANLGGGALAGGSVTTTNGLNNLAQWDGATWSTPAASRGEGILGSSVAALAGQGSNVYVGGTFGFAGGVSASNIARWEGEHWFALGSGVAGDVYALCTVGNDLFAGGRFSSAGGSNALNIARWDGASWHALGNGVTGPVYALAKRGNQLFVGGAFREAGGLVASNVACWDGSWSTLGSGLGGTVRALAVNSNFIFAGGSFKSADGNPATNVACWNGASWSALGGGVSGSANPIARVKPPPVSALALRGNDLYVAGDFALAGTVAATNIAKWDGTNWSALDLGLNGLGGGLMPPPTVSALAVNGELLYAGGTFNKAGSLTARGLAQWNGTGWAVVGGGIGNDAAAAAVLALAVKGPGLCVGGTFQFAGQQPASDFCIRSVTPLLSITQLAGIIQIAWPAALGNYHLEECSGLAATNWAEGSAQPSLNGDSLEVRLNPSGVTHFFRLKSNE